MSVFIRLAYLRNFSALFKRFGQMKEAQLTFGVVKHTRFRPKHNSFGYRVFTLKIPLRLRQADTRLLSRHGLGDNQFRLISFYDKDHGQGEVNSLAWIEALLTQYQIDGVDGEIWLQTFPRVLGYTFNPVSFWICTRSNGEVRAIVAEVNNTFGERHCYLLAKDSGESIRSGETLASRKVFHVSPFCEVQGDYHFRFLFSEDSQAKNRTLYRIELLEDNQPLINTSISGTERPLNRRNLYLAILSYPLMSIGVIVRIHWQAIKLWLKGVPFHSKPQPPEFEVTR